MSNKLFKRNLLNNNMNNTINQTLRNKNFNTGRIGEIKFIELLRNKYKNIIDNNEKDKYSHMDFLTNDNNELIEHEHKNRSAIKHNQFRGLMVNECKINYSVQQIKKGIRQIYYWTCKNGTYFWELTDLEKQKNEMVFYKNGNFKTKEGNRNVVDIKTEFLTKFEY